MHTHIHAQHREASRTLEPAADKVPPMLILCSKESVAAFELRNGVLEKARCCAHRLRCALMEEPAQSTPMRVCMHMRTCGLGGLAHVGVPRWLAMCSLAYPKRFRTPGLGELLEAQGQGRAFLVRRLDHAKDQPNK